MWQYNYTGTVDDQNYLLHRDHKYTSKKMINGKWVYYYGNEPKNSMNAVASKVNSSVNNITSNAYKSAQTVASSARKVGNTSETKLGKNLSANIGKAEYKKAGDDAARMGRDAVRKAKAVKDQQRWTNKAKKWLQDKFGGKITVEFSDGTKHTLKK